jgi:hypothetical protein
MFLCDFNQFAIQHYQLFLNFTAITKPPVHVPNYGELLTPTKLYSVKDSISLHAVDSTNIRALYCDRNSESPRLRPISLSSPFSIETWVTLGFLLLFCAIASSFTVFDTHSDSKLMTSIIFLRTIFNSLVELNMCLLEKDVGRKNCTKALIGLIVICVGNDYKNYLTIDLVFPRASEAISTLTELLDLNFNLLQPVNVKQIGNVKLPYLKELNYHLEIDETKREKYVREVERWWKLILFSEDSISSELTSATSKNAWILNAPYHIQVYNLNLIIQRNYPLSCHFVRRSFAHQFRELYFLNPKAEEFKWWTTKFLDHGLFVFWKRLESHKLTLYQRYVLLRMRSKKSNSSSTETLDISNFIGQVHLIVFYTSISVLTAICIAIFLLECAIPKARELSLFVQVKVKHVSLQLLWTIVRFLFLMSRLIGSLYESRNRS